MARTPSTPALRLLREEGIEYELLTYPYVERGGAPAAAEALGLDLHEVVKTLVFEDEARSPLIVCQHGDREVSPKALARVLGVRTVRPCAPATAERHTGYRVGGTSPFGTRRALPVYVEASVLELPRIALNAGARGVLVRVAPDVLPRLVSATPVQVAT